MLRHKILLVKYPSDQTQKSIELRLSEHLKTLRRAMIHVELDALLAEDPPRPADPKAAADNPRQMAPIITLADADCRKIARRAKRLIERREAASGLAHLRKEDRDRLAALRDGVNLIRLPSEHRADEIAAELHAEYPWMAPATEIVWHALRKSVCEGWPGVRLPPILLDGPPSIANSTWARHLATALRMPSMSVEATVENASFGLLGCQRGWATAGPGRLLQLILQERVGNPIVVIDELEKAGRVTGTNGGSYDLCGGLLPLLEPATASHWTCPYFQVPFDLGQVSWVMTVNATRPLPEPLLSRCPSIRLPQLTTSDLTGFARRQGARRGLSDVGIEVIVEAIEASAGPVQPISLRTVMRMIARAETLEAGPRQH